LASLKYFEIRAKKPGFFVLSAILSPLILFHGGAYAYGKTGNTC